MKFTDVFKNKSTAFSFFLSIIVWGIGTGCFAATMNNFLSDMHDMTSQDRGSLEFFREMPGLALVFLFALLNRMSDWKILRLGTMISMLGAALLFVPSNKVIVTFFIMIWSLGEHLIMPVRQAIAIQIAKPENAGQSLGFLTSAMNFGNVTGSAIVAVIFYVGVKYSGLQQRYLYDIVWGLIAVLMIVSTISTFNKNAPDETAKRPKLYFHRKFNKFYALELFYGARKQIFFTFAPYVLIREYGFSTARMAVLLAVCAIINIFAAPAIGKLTDRLGYRNIMIWDTIILCFVCLLYGFAGDIFPRSIAYWVVYINYIFDAIISTTALATNIYIRGIAETHDELSSTMSTGISINHFISILAGPVGGWIWAKYGIGLLFTFSAIMAICNSIFAYTLPKPNQQNHASA
jgi:predicted MFS family arabinose efflux permease